MTPTIDDSSIGFYADDSAPDEGSWLVHREIEWLTSARTTRERRRAAPLIAQYIAVTHRSSGPICFRCRADFSPLNRPMHIGVHTWTQVPNSAADKRRFERAVSTGAPPPATHLVGLCRRCCGPRDDPSSVAGAVLSSAAERALFRILPATPGTVARTSFWAAGEEGEA